MHHLVSKPFFQSIPTQPVFCPRDKSVEGCPSLADIPCQQGGLAR